MAGALRLPSPGPVTVGLTVLVVVVLLARRATLREAGRKVAPGAVVRPFYVERSR